MKKINLDGPDNWCSWMEEYHQVYFNKRQCGGGSLMDWGMIFSTGQIFVKTLPGRINSNTKFRQKIQAHECHRHPFIERKSPRWFPCATKQLKYSCFKKKLELFEETGIEPVLWPSRSPDLNYIENVWRNERSKIYDGPQSKNEQELVEEFLKP